MRIFTSVFSILALTFALGCSGGDSGDGGGDGADAAVSTVDGGGGGNPDAAVSSAADGQACTASEADPTGGCPAGFDCLSASAGGAGACFKSCATAGAVCEGYQGPGASMCIISITDQTGNTVGNACGTVCGDTTGQIPGCAGGACDGTCPGTWTCVDSSQAGIKICQ